MKKIKFLVLTCLFLLLSSFSFGDENSSILLKRQNAREFSTEKLTNTQKEQIVEALFLAPTVGGERTGEFIIIDDPKVLESIREISPNSSPLKTTQFLVIIAENTNNVKYKELVEIDSGIVVQTILTRATELGLSTRPMGIIQQKDRVEKIKKILNLPEGVTPYMMIAIGHSTHDEVAAATSTVKNQDKNKVHYNKF